MVERLVPWGQFPLGVCFETLGKALIYYIMLIIIYILSQLIFFSLTSIMSCE